MMFVQPNGLKLFAVVTNAPQVNQLRNGWMKTGSMKKQYYYWQRKIRNLVAGTTGKSLHATRPTGEVTFVEMQAPIEQPVECPDKAVASSGPAALIRAGKLEIELSNDI